VKKWIFGLIAAAVAGLLAVFVIAPGIFNPGASPSNSSSPEVTRTGATGVVKVLATTNVWGDIAKQLGGDWVEVTVVLDDPMQDPHSYEASARDQLAVNDAELIVMNGGGYDEFMHTLIDSAESVKFVVEAVPELDSTGESDAHAHSHDHGNEHVWYDFDAVAEFSETFVAALTDIRPEAFEDVNQNFDSFKVELDNLETRLEGLAGHSLGLGVVATEGVGNLLLEHAGFENLTPEALADAIEEETEVPPAALAETETLIKNNLVSILITNLQVEDQVSERLRKLAEAEGVPVVQLSELIPEADMNYFDWMNQVLDQIQEAVY
jgi:zinc/manganese transport system substrate-binding protein